MNARGFARFEEALRLREAAVVQMLRKRDGIAIDRNPDSADEAQSSLDRELKAVTLHRDSCQLAEVRLALQRIADGSYGSCLSCENAVGEKRLLAVPWARYCIRCQERIDQDGESDEQAGVLVAVAV